MSNKKLATPADVKRVLQQDLNAVRFRVSRLPSGGLDVRALSPRFATQDEAQALLDTELGRADLTLPPNSMVLLRSELDPDEEPLFAPPKATRPTWADALLLEPETPLPLDDRGFGECKVVAFWGLKGGVGRTTALAHVANLLGRRRRVLAVDLDLDSPGLVATLCDPIEPSSERFDDLIVRAGNPSTSNDQLLSAVGKTIRTAREDGGASVWVLGAAAADADFIQRLLGPLTPGALYRAKSAPLRRVLRLAIQSVSAEYLLLDARSGYCDESAMAVLDLADEVIVFASPARSTFVSIAPAVEALERSRRAIGRPAKVRFVAGMLPSDETLRSAIKEELLALAEETRARVSKDLETPRESLPGDVEIQSMEYSTRIVDNEARLVHGVIDGYRDLAERLDPREISPVIAKVDTNFIRQVLTEVVIPTPQAEDESNPIRLEELFTVTSKLREFARHEVSLVLGAKGTGKSFLRRLCLHSPAILAKRSGMTSLANTRFLEVYAEDDRGVGPHIDSSVLKKLDEGKPDWAALWSAIALVKVASLFPKVAEALDAFDSRIGKTVRDTLGLVLPSKIVAALMKLAREPDLSSAWEVVAQEGARTDTTIGLIFDQLDVALGSGAPKRSRRRALLEGLLEASSMWRERRNIGAKIFLREDLWNEVEIEEKAKFATRTVTLTWSKEEIWRLCIRAFGVGSKTFGTHLRDRLGIDIDRLDDTTQDEQGSALALIWGERMGGSESDTFSTSWAYRRLHDGKQRLFPRAALWLLRFAVEVVKNMGLRESPPLLSPDALRTAMPRVAAQRLDELHNEAPDDWKLVIGLKGFASYMDEKKFVLKLVSSLKSTPVEARKAVEKLVDLGVLERGSRREGTPTLRIVDLYAFAEKLEIDRLGRR
jgi:MinD-like ATPase involved in chromosome partitioning or flagellar assembly